MDWWGDGSGVTQYSSTPSFQYSNSLLHTREELYGNDV